MYSRILFYWFTHPVILMMVSMSTLNCHGMANKDNQDAIRLRFKQMNIDEESARHPRLIHCREGELNCVYFRSSTQLQRPMMLGGQV